MSTLPDSHDFTDKTVHPFVTYASGVGRAQQVYTASCPGAHLEPSLVVQREEVPDPPKRRRSLTARRPAADMSPAG